MLCYSAAFSLSEAIRSLRIFWRACRARKNKWQDKLSAPMPNPLIYSGPHTDTFTSSCKCISNTVLTSAIKHIYVFQHMIAGAPVSLHNICPTLFHRARSSSSQDLKHVYCNKHRECCLGMCAMPPFYQGSEPKRLTEKLAAEGETRVTLGQYSFPKLGVRVVGSRSSLRWVKIASGLQR